MKTQGRFSPGYSVKAGIIALMLVLILMAVMRIFKAPQNDIAEQPVRFSASSSVSHEPNRHITPRLPVKQGEPSIPELDKFRDSLNPHDLSTFLALYETSEDCRIAPKTREALAESTEKYLQDKNLQKADPGGTHTYQLIDYLRERFELCREQGPVSVLEGYTALQYAANHGYAKAMTRLATTGPVSLYDGTIDVNDAEAVLKAQSAWLDTRINLLQQAVGKGDYSAAIMLSLDYKDARYGESEQNRYFEVLYATLAYRLAESSLLQEHYYNANVKAKYGAMPSWQQAQLDLQVASILSDVEANRGLQGVNDSNK